MTLTGIATQAITNLWLLLLSRIVLAVVLYYAVMKVARVQILKECEQFVLSKIRK